MSSFKTCATKNKIIWCMLTQIWSACTDIIFSYFRPFFALLPHYWPPKLKFGKNEKKHLEILSYYTCVLLIKIIWCMVPEMWTSTDRMFLPLCAIFCPFTSPPPPNSPKNKTLKKMKKTSGDIIILHNCTKNHDHMLYCSWDMVRDGCNCYFSFWAMLFPFTPLTIPKMKNSKQWKKGLGISFYTCVPKMIITCYIVPEISDVLDVILFLTLSNF